MSSTRLFMSQRRHRCEHCGEVFERVSEPWRGDEEYWCGRCTPRDTSRVDTSKLPEPLPIREYPSFSERHRWRKYQQHQWAIKHKGKK